MLSETIYKLRTQRGWSQITLAQKLHVSGKTIKNWEAGISNPSAENIAELARAFAISADDLLGVSSSTTIVLDSLSPEDQKKLRAMFQAYISCC